MWNFWPLLFLSGVEGAWKGRVLSTARGDAHPVDPRGNSLKFIAISWSIFAFIRLDLWLAHYPVQPVLPEILFWWSGALLAGVYVAYLLRSRARARRQAILETRLAELRCLETPELLALVAEGLRQQGCQVGAASEDSPLQLLASRPDGERQAVMLRAGDPSVGKPAVLALYHALAETGAGLGLFLTPGDFTAAARQWAQGKPLRLLDGLALVDFLDGSRPS